MMNTVLDFTDMSTITPNASTPWAPVDCSGNDVDIRNQYTFATLYEAHCPSTVANSSTYTPYIHHDNVTTDMTIIRSLSINDCNADDSIVDDKAIREAFNHVLRLSWPCIRIIDGGSLSHCCEVAIENDHGDQADDAPFGTSSGNHTDARCIHREKQSILIKDAQYKCFTERDVCAAVRIGHCGKIQRWAKDAELHYVVCVESFPPLLSLLVGEAMKTAIAMWTGIGVRFKRVERNKPATFAVVYDKSYYDNAYAFSFFPTDSPEKLELVVCPLSHSNNNYKYLANILAHEIGHILGLRHEFAHEKERYNPSVLLGNEDSQSVMKYYKDLSKLCVSEKDLEGLRMLYAYDEPVYDGLSVIDISPKLHTFSERRGTDHISKMSTRRLSF